MALSPGEPGGLGAVWKRESKTHPSKPNWQERIHILAYPSFPMDVEKVPTHPIYGFEEISPGPIHAGHMESIFPHTWPHIFVMKGS